MTERPISDATKRMAKILGAEFVPDSRMTPTPPEPDLIAKIEAILGADPICMGRVASGSVEQIAALIARPPIEKE